MNLHPMKLVTIICEAVLEERIVEILRESGAQGHTAFDVRGSGRQGQRSADLVESGNVRIEVIAKPAVATAVLDRLHHELFAAYAMVAYESDVGVMRPEKF
jgi:nitrogen regulatory protein PII